MRQLGATAPIALRVNPDVDAKTHEKIATGRKEDKFGVPIARAREIYAQAAPSLPGIQVVGVDVHIGSQLTDLAPFEDAFTKIAELTRTLRADGTRSPGWIWAAGLGIPYARSNETPPLPTGLRRDDPPCSGRSGCRDRNRTGPVDCRECGLLVASVIYTKPGEGRDFLILDAAMNDLIRPAMYGAHHDIVPECWKRRPPPTSARSILSGRSANRVIHSPRPAPCRRWMRVRLSPSGRRALMAP